MSGRLLDKLRERGVLRVAISYVVIAWLVLQIADVILSPWHLPAWVHRAPLVIAGLGFPIAIALAWFFELGAAAPQLDTVRDGVARPVATGWRRHVDVAIISVLGAIVAFFVLRDAGWLGDALRAGAKVESSSIAVLPFANLGGEAERHVSDGLSDELRNQFSRMQSLRVTARSSSIAFEDLKPRPDAVAIAAKLAVAALLEGTVGRDQGRLRVSVQLIGGHDGKVMWAERFDRPDKDLLAVQVEIANAVVAAVLPRFAASGKAAPPPPTEDPVAYDLYLLGREKLKAAEGSAIWHDVAAQQVLFSQAADRFRAAIAADPSFAQAHASLARVLLSTEIRRQGESTRRADWALELEHATLPDIERALALDPKNAEAWFVKGRLLAYTEQLGAADAFARAVELDPSHAKAMQLLGWSAISDGRLDERHRLVLKALALDPMDLSNHSSAALSAWILGRRDELRSIVDRMLVVFPDDSVAALIACAASARVGEFDEALACLAEAVKRFSSTPRIVAEFELMSGEIFESLGQEDWALTYYEQAQAHAPIAALEILRLRRDVPGLERLGMEALARGPSMPDWPTAYALAQVRSTEMALEIYRQSGMDELMQPNVTYKPPHINSYLQMIALMRRHGEAVEAQRHLDLALPFTDKLLRHGARSTGLRLASARANALAGRNDAALEQLRFAVEAIDSPRQVSELETDMIFAELRNDPRFVAQLKLVREQQERLVARLPETFRRHGLTWSPPPEPQKR